MASSTQPRNQFQLENRSDGKLEIRERRTNKNGSGDDQGQQYALLSFGTRIAAGIIVPILLGLGTGVFLDTHLNTKPVFILIGIVFGLLIAGVNSYIAIRKLT